MTINVGDRVRFNSEQLPQDRIIDPPDRDATDVLWSEYFGSLSGVVDAVNSQTGEYRVRGRDSQKNPYTVWVESDWLDVTDPADVE